MLAEVAVVGGVIGVAFGLLEVSHRLDEGAARPLTPEAAIREAMRGPEAGAVRAEFRRSGIQPFAPRRPVGFGL